MGILKNIFKGTAYTIATAVGLLANEYTSYSAFQWGSFNAACSLDPTCRHLNSEEIELAQSIYGDTIDYSQVRVFERLPFFLDPLAAQWGGASTFDSIYEGLHKYGDIYQASLDEQLTFIHEMGHVWQFQNLPLSESTKAFSNDWRDNTYYYEPGFFDNFLDFGIEQQPTIIEDIFRMRALGLAEEDLEACLELNAIENLAKQVLPIEISDCSHLAPDAPEI